MGNAGILPAVPRASRPRHTAGEDARRTAAGTAALLSAVKRCKRCGPGNKLISARTFPAAWRTRPEQFLPTPPPAFAPIAAGLRHGVGPGPPALVSPEIVPLPASGRGASP